MRQDAPHQTFSLARLVFAETLGAGKFAQIDGVDDGAVVLAIQVFDLHSAEDAFEQRVERLFLVTEMRSGVIAKLAEQFRSTLQIARFESADQPEQNVAQFAVLLMGDFAKAQMRRSFPRAARPGIAVCLFGHIIRHGFATGATCKHLYRPLVQSARFCFSIAPVLFRYSKEFVRRKLMTACIVGWSHTPFGKHENEDVESLIVQAARGALEDSGLEAKDIDEIFVGHCNAGFSRQEFTASLALQADDAFRFVPATRVENACATGSAAIHQGINSIEAKRARFVLVVQR